MRHEPAFPPDLAAEGLRHGIPCFRNLCSAILDLLPFDEPVAVDVLDLGAGTGALSAAVLARFPAARVTLVESESGDLDVATRRLASVAERIRVVADDYARIDLPGKYDAVVSVLSLHRLGNIDTRALYRSIYASLRPGGAFICADRVAPVSKEMDESYRRGEGRLLHELGVDTTCGSSEANDNRAPLRDHLQWLDNAGFRDVDVSFRVFRYAVYGGRRPRL